MRMKGVLLWLLLLSCAPPAFGGLSLAEEAQKQAASATLDFANGLYSRKMYGPAISEYEKFIGASPESQDAASAYFRLADSHYFLKDYPRAVARFDEFRQKFPADPRVPIALFRTGTSYYHQKKFDEAEKAFSGVDRHAAAEVNAKSGALFYRAKIAEAKGDRSKALGLLRHLTSQYPDSEYAVYACLAAGDIFAARGKEKEAVRAWSIITERRAPSSVVEEAVLKTADLYFSSKKYLDARFHYQKAYQARRPASERVMRALFNCDYLLKDLDALKALYAAEEARLKGTALGADADYLSAILLYEKNEFAEAVSRLDRVLEAPIAETLRKKAASVRSFVQGESLRERGDFEQALAAYNEVLKAEDGPYFRPALYQAGFLSSELKKTAEAKDLFSRYIQKYFEGDEVERAALERVQIDLNDENFPSAVQGAEGFLTSYPKSRFQDVALYKLGLGFAGEKDFGQASKTFERVVSGFPQSELYADALYGAAAGYDSAGEVAKAVPYYERLVKDHPEHPLYADIVQRLGFLYVQGGELDKAAAFYEDVLLNKPQVPLESSVAFWTIRYNLDRGRYERMKPILTLLPKRYADEQLAHEINFFLGESLMGSKNYDEAAKYYTRAESVRPDGAYAAHAQLGLGIVAAAKGQLDQADSYFAKALGFPNEVDVALRARFEMANLKLLRGQLDEAAKAFMHVAILYDDEKFVSASLFKAGECFEKLGRTEEAGQAFSELVRRYPKSEWAAKIAARAPQEAARGK